MKFPGYDAEGLLKIQRPRTLLSDRLFSSAEITAEIASIDSRNDLRPRFVIARVMRPLQFHLCRVTAVRVYPVRNEP